MAGCPRALFDPVRDDLTAPDHRILSRATAVSRKGEWIFLPNRCWNVRGRRKPDLSYRRIMPGQHAPRLASRESSAERGSALACAPTWSIWPGGPRHVQPERVKAPPPVAQAGFYLPAAGRSGKRL